MVALFDSVLIEYLDEVTESMLEQQSFKYFWSKLVAHDGKVKHPAIGHHGKTPEEYCYMLMKSYLYRDNSLTECKLSIKRTDADLIATSLVSLTRVTAIDAEYCFGEPAVLEGAINYLMDLVDRYSRE